MSTRRERCPEPACREKRRRNLAITTNPDGSEVFYCHRCGWKGNGQAGEAKPPSNVVPFRQRADPLGFWNETAPVIHHPYLSSKGVGAHGVRQRHGWLVVPVRRGSVLLSVQRIDAGGTKRFLRGCSTKGGYHLIGTPRKGERLWLCEGYATGASLHEYFEGEPVVVGFDCGNLMPVAQAIVGTRLGVDLAVMADDDQWTEGNPGMTHALAVARATGARVMKPDWARVDLASKPTDFNDWVRLYGR